MSVRPDFPVPDDLSDPPTAVLLPARQTLDRIAESARDGAPRSPTPKPTAEASVRDQAARQWKIDARDVAEDPLLSCLYELTRILGRPTSREGLVAGLPLENDRLTPKLLLRAANRAGFVAKISRHPIDRRMAPLCPAIALLSDERAVVITEIDRDRRIARVVYPQAPGEQVEFELADLEAQSTGFVISIKNQYAFDARAPETRKLAEGHWFWSALIKPWRVYRDVLVASLLINLFALAVPLFTMNVYDRVIPNSAVETLWTFAIGVMAVLGFDVAMKVLRAHFIDVAGKRVDHEMSSHVMAKVMNTRLEARPASVGSFAANLRAFESVREFMTSASLGMLVDLPFALLFVAVMAAVGGWAAAPTMVAFPVVIGVSLIAQRRMKPLTDATQRASQQKHATLIESLVGIEQIKALNIEGRTQKRWEESGKLLAEVGARIKFWSALAVNVTAWVGQMVTISTVVLGVYLIADNAMTMGALIACTQLAGRALAPLGQLSSLLVQYDNTRSAYEGVDRMMTLPEERQADSNFVMRPRIRGAIQFDNVSFSYPNAELPALDRVSFTIQPGERVALIGRIGSGKSTIEKLLMGLYRPTAGTIRFDGIDGNQIDPAQIRSSIGYVPQDVTLFFGTLRENIAIAAPLADDSAVLKAAALAGMRQFIERHPKGVNLPIGERGESLSGGQRQSVAIARAVVNEPPILILDEPTSSMDSDSEARVLENLRSFSAGRTMVLVTHRMTLLDIVDRLIVVDQGRIVADGPKDKVLRALRGG
ncbi:MAG: type I secretion system permease/ATPase [Burkholderiaceae bacterium]|nr:type I secretion system permease/ATPase [Burkholderiaceae bacterium]